MNMKTSVNPKRDGEALLEQLQMDLKAVAVQTADREAALFDKTQGNRQNYDVWHARWMAQSEGLARQQKNWLEERLRTADVAATLEKELEETTLNLRHWLQATKVLLR
jgi:hypothetical protein